MKILHVCLAGPFSDGFTYQENLLTKYHSLMGHKVSVITSTWSIGDDGNLHELSPKMFTNKDNVTIHRLKMRGKNNPHKKIKRYENYTHLLHEISPDIIFVHGSQFWDVNPLIEYKIKNRRKISVYVDNHADFSNSARSFLSREILHKLIWRYKTKKMLPVVNKFYGVLPSRVDFLTAIYKVPMYMVELLNLGGDDEYVELVDPQFKKKLRRRYNYDDNQKLIITGGKIDNAKKEVLLLMEYVRGKKDLFLIIFGSIDKHLENDIIKSMGDNIVHIGWVNARESYDLFGSADLVVFPGRHSVYWEQVVSLKKPIVAKYWEGTTHLDIGGNVVYVDYKMDEKEKLFMALDEILYTSKLLEMTRSAGNTNYRNFLYSEIAKKSIES